jgi:hypothetical protein
MNEVRILQYQSNPVFRIKFLFLFKIGGWIHYKADENFLSASLMSQNQTTGVMESVASSQV